MKFKYLGLNRTARLVLHDVGLLHVPGVMALLSLPVCIWFGESEFINPFLETAIASFGVTFATNNVGLSTGISDANLHRAAN